ncbi:MAG: M48 family metallopeptidase [Gammaproteobacteria bacterium]|nr:M48 family metallopeptidase [Gammaproteobacteria bacterium]
MNPNNLIHYGAHQIPYEIIKTNKIRKRLTIKVSRKLCVSAHAPIKMSDKEIHAFVHSKSSWIFKKLQEFKQTEPAKLAIAEKAYVSGESHYYLGKPYLLDIHIEKGTMPSVSLIENKLRVTLSQPNPGLVKALLQRFYQQQAHLIFSERLHYLVTITSWVKTIPELKMSAMKSRWGTCSSKGKITMNYRLIKAPVECIDYVLLHELCHLKFMNHSDKFYQLLTGVLPHWSTIEKQLRELTVLCS